MAVKLRDLFILSGIVLAILLPFTGKPFNVDDPFYLKAAEQFARDPLRPYSYSINWSGETRNAWDRMEATFPPLVTAYTALAVKLTEEKELALHLFFVIFPLSAVWAIYFIAIKFVKNPLIPAMVAAVSPAFSVSATSLMLDVPLAALTLASLAFFIYGADEGNAVKLVFGGVLAGCAVLAKYSGILALPVIFFYLYFSKKLRYWPYLTVPAVFLALWSVHNLIVYGGAHFFLASAHIGKGISLHKVFAFGTFFSGVFTFPLFFPLAADRKDIKALAIWSAVLLVLGKIVFEEWVTAALFAVFCASTLFFLYRMIVQRLQIGAFLAAWFLTGFLAVMVLEPWISARYLLVLLPPSALIFARIIESFNGRTGKLITAASLTGAALFSLSLGAADYLWAFSYRKAADYITAKGYNKGYFIGHFGFQYYLEKAGMTALEVDKPLEGEGFVIAARIPDPQRPSPETASALKLVELKSFDSRFPVRLMNHKARAGFYSSYWGILPFSISLLPLDDIAVFKFHNPVHPGSGIGDKERK